MMTPEVGQVVRLEGYGERLVVKSVSEDEQRVSLVTMADHPAVYGEVPVRELLPGEDLSAG